MTIDIRSASVDLSADTRAAFENEARTALARFEPQLAHVRLSFFDDNGPKGGPALRCRIQGSAHGLDRIVSVEDVREEPGAALAIALERFREALARQLKRRTEGRRSVEPRRGERDPAGQAG